MLHNPLGTASIQSPIVTLFVDSDVGASERRFDRSTTIANLKLRLEPITGVSAGDMRIALHARDDDSCSRAPLCLLDDDTRMLGFYPLHDYMKLRVEDTSSAGKARGARNQYTDTSLVEKYEMGDDEYGKRNDSVRAFKMRNKLGRFADGASTGSGESESKEEELFKEEAAKIQVGNRCKVKPDPVGGGGMAEEQSFVKVGTVKFVGTASFKPGYWVGVEYDEPVGKHDGSIAGVSYFTSKPKHGVFVRPNRVEVGDFPEEDPFADDDDEI
ncbi:hypothetical protein HK101_001987 [Irineochytrium annulatum]|nr:hypothetical protein HK101_001987 [Irineochytrium annulatum]